MRESERRLVSEDASSGERVSGNSARFAGQPCERGGVTRLGAVAENCYSLCERLRRIANRRQSGPQRLRDGVRTGTPRTLDVFGERRDALAAKIVDELADQKRIAPRRLVARRNELAVSIRSELVLHDLGDRLLAQGRRAQSLHNWICGDPRDQIAVCIRIAQAPDANEEDR